ncbi:MAG: 50S ribosomal protein L21 [Flavobacteriaceae bacterium]|nr:50S ribosomal protein L21 [Flavobacteriaceae bacterium]|tara:strand:+ start:772 stop:1287 length:516 start_codon:yes stop_codon:yes gene_type:complete
MFAVVEILGQQFKVEKNQKLLVNKLNEKEGSKISFDNVLLIDNGKEFSLGTPKVEGCFVEAKIIKHIKGDKVIVFKKKRRKGYRVKNGHKQHLSEILIESISKNKNSSNKGKDKKVVSTKNNSKELNVDKEKADLKSKTLSELKDIAKSKKITGYSSMKKNDLIKSINSLN